MLSILSTVFFSFSSPFAVASYQDPVFFLWLRVKAVSYLDPAEARKKEVRREPAEGAEETGEKRGCCLTLERGSRADEKKEKKGGGVGVCRGVFIIIRVAIIAISITIPGLVAALGGILPPGCGTLSSARCLTLV